MIRLSDFFPNGYPDNLVADIVQHQQRKREASMVRMRQRIIIDVNIRSWSTAFRSQVAERRAWAIACERYPIC